MRRATGQVSVSTTQQLGGWVNVDLSGALGVPLLVSGTVDQPEVSLTPVPGSVRPRGPC